MSTYVSQRRLAELLCCAGLQIDKNGVQRIESGERFVTDVELVYLARVLGVSYETLLVETGQEDIKEDEEPEIKEGSVPDGIINLIHVENMHTILRDVLKHYRHYFQILELPDQDQEIINAFLDGMRYKDLADQYGLCVSAIRAKIIRFKMKVSSMERAKMRSEELCDYGQS